MKGKQAQRKIPQTAIPGNRMAIAGMVFVSGFAGLVYQVLWMKQLGLLFGNTAQAASATLAAFFVGLGVGSWWWGRRAGAIARPLRLYAWLEAGIAGSAVLYFGLLLGFKAFYPSLYSVLAGSGWLLAAKLLLAMLLVFPAAFFMGGTVPVIAQVMIRERVLFGRMAAMIYGINTLGAALGVWAAAFIFMPLLGFRMSYALAVLLSASVGGLAWRLSRSETPVAAHAAHATDDDRANGALAPRLALAGLCFFSGFVVLALEVVWTRIFAQVHENSVYAFAIILIVVLIGLAMGAGVSSLLSRFVQRQMLALAVMTVTGGSLLVLGPNLLMHVTNGLVPLNAIESWDDHVHRLFMMGIGGIGYIVIALGTVFPFLMKIAERELKVPGRTLGQLLAVNTAGAIIGSLLCGFVMLPAWGMWGSMKALTAVYLLVSLLLPIGWNKAAVACRVAAVGSLVLLMTVLDPTKLPVMGTPPGKESPKVLQVWEESDCTVLAVEKSSGHRAIMINSSYALGSTAAYIEQANQSRIPLHLFGNTESICFIGLGTGMSAGAAFDERFPRVKRVISCELSPAVVEASRKWIPPMMTGGLFTDPRSTVLVEDGRQYLMVTRERFDMINSDLFLPYQRGAGSLYSLDHFRTCATRLSPDGVFVQWLPLYQLTEYEFGVIVRTMLEAFPEVTMWRNNFVPGQEKVALIGRLKASPMVVAPVEKGDTMKRAVDGLEWLQTTPDMARVEAETMPFLYAGNLTQARELFAGYPLNTDDKPVIEYQTPKLFREVAANDKVIWCVGPKLVNWIDRIFAACPIAKDPAWQGHPASSQHLIKAGTAFHRTMVSKALNQRDEAEANWGIFLREWRQAAE